MSLRARLRTVEAYFRCPIHDALYECFDCNAPPITAEERAFVQAMVRTMDHLAGCGDITYAPVPCWRCGESTLVCLACQTPMDQSRYESYLSRLTTEDWDHLEEILAKVGRRT
jgi:hypothetical protein